MESEGGKGEKSEGSAKLGKGMEWEEKERTRWTSKVG